MITRRERSTSVAVTTGQVAEMVAASSWRGLPSQRDLLLQALLHLPRLADSDAIIDRADALAEIDRLACWRHDELLPVRHLARAPHDLPAVREFEVVAIPNDEAATILDHFHYLRSARSDSATFAAVTGGRIAALCSVSPLDLPYMANRAGLASATEAQVVARVFAFDWAPRNLISYLLSRAEHLVTSELGPPRLLLTYLNPNMGFTGASYRATNWLAFGSERGTRYAYVHGRYVTDRALRNARGLDAASVEHSSMPLKPLLLMCRIRDKALRRMHPDGFSFGFTRPTPDVPPAAGGWRESPVMTRES
jgi:hypothetical protein